MFAERSFALAVKWTDEANSFWCFKAKKYRDIL